MPTPSPSPAVQLEQDNSYLPEVWALYAIGVIVILARIGVRLRTVGIGGFQGDDYLVFLCLTLYTINAIIVQITYYTGGNIDVSASQVLTLPDRDVEILEYGSKLEYASWYTYPGVIWTLKLQVLFFFRRLTLGIFHTRMIKILFWIVGLSWIALILTVSLTCRPYHYNWMIRPLPGPQCTFRPQNFWVLVVLNVLSDAAILAIPIPILWSLRISPLRKLGVSLLLCSGLFIISTAIVRAVLTLRGAPSVININRWGFRETAVGIVAVTAAVLAPLFTRAFWRKGRYIPNDDLHRQRTYRVNISSLAAGSPEDQAIEEDRFE
ncbi:hypothetical protein S40293_03220 [Stachybotrys chartarum IBT 40293]|nr:hypothetical protein S40293_03220 [Stachybotrys chartarum IBT 40293]